jgi:NADH dehydrogenase FAD-containing subunit
MFRFKLLSSITQLSHISATPYQVATSLLNAEDVGAPVRGLFRNQENVNFRLAMVTGIDVPPRKIRLKDGEEISYDYLVLAGGAMVNYFGTLEQPNMHSPSIP